MQKIVFTIAVVSRPTWTGKCLLFVWLFLPHSDCQFVRFNLFHETKFFWTLVFSSKILTMAYIDRLQPAQLNPPVHTHNPKACVYVHTYICTQYVCKLPGSYVNTLHALHVVQGGGTRMHCTHLPKLIRYIHDTYGSFLTNAAKWIFFM